MSTNNKYDFSSIAKSFSFGGSFVKSQPYGFGHINDTYEAYFEMQDGKMKRFILQRINNNVFKNPEKLMENIQSVTAFLRKKIIEAGGDPDRETLNLIPAVDGKSFYKSDEDNYWRAYVFIEGAQTYQVVEKPDHFYNAGRAFGKFQKLLSDYPAESLFETIQNFHNTKVRFETFINAVEKDVMNRAKDVRAEIDFALKRYNEAVLLVNMLERGELPLRVTHNDTKFNNVMIDDESGEGICVIDLDTVMPGLSLYDFGDAIRFGTNPAAEDEKDLSKVWMDLALFEQFTKGFLSAAGDSLTKAELLHLPHSAKIMTYECGIRFLTDFLSGDTYFKIHREGHNLDRARTQFKLVADMEQKFEQMQKIINGGI
ncbi:phosphotransferase family enzyme [Ruminiclostridium sufflavum DSM 19573]|uniref:Phosphotransferase family enzyme n=1 Tax=Ruminiclostridium sufflavum DSM 19573 TaxID=1121337 RepID=A0A318XNU8_9FIRM|nr:aminoglycoside phosphotransferase family protein [Ruminiclostridium sufflavum]PYG88713.1 phosphotransferase family enzyme [Ruminiclostridium sufflavum DSM 19573]